MRSSIHCKTDASNEQQLRRYKRRRRTTTTNTIMNKSSFLYFLLSSSTIIVPIQSAIWINGPEDRFFCGYKWDDDNCQSRQHCPTGRSEECEGNEDGIKCFANTNCDTRYGDGDWFVSGETVPQQSPAGGSSKPTYTGKSPLKTDHYWCGVGLDDAKSKCGVHCPRGTSGECPQGEICYHEVLTCDARNVDPPTASPGSPSRAPIPKGPTQIPTDMPIEPPDPLPFPSTNPKDHMFCGVGLDDANTRCEIPCPTAKECPSGEICYFGTQCDSRTFSPTPPPTRRPTAHPTVSPTENPTDTMPPSYSPTTSHMPTATPSEQIPTKSPTPSPTNRPTFQPMPSLVNSFYCGIDWKDAITNCKRKCPSGESTECPFDENCFSLTPCTEEKGYPEDYGLVDGGATDVSGDCVPFQVTIVADHWPKETSWEIINTQVEDEIIAEGSSDDLAPGEPVQFLECVNNKNGCYEFRINDSGGDGMCCEHGNGSYKISYDGVQLKEGAAFYDSETTPFGLCGDTEQPTKKPTSSNGGGGGGGEAGDKAYRCIANPLVESGYEVLSGKCDLFVDCFNKHISVGDDWYCGDDEQCIETPSCMIELEDVPIINEEEGGGGGGGEDLIIEAGPTPEIIQLPIEIPSPTTNPPTPKVVVDASRPTVSRPKPSGQSFLSTQNKPPTPVPIKASDSPTFTPTTNQPTIGPCGGPPCNQDDHCRSKYGFCGPGATYCGDDAIWSSDCVGEEEISVEESVSSVTLSPTTTSVVESTGEEATTISPPTTSSSVASPQPISAKKPWSKPGGGKPSGGGKGPTKPARTQAPIALPTRKPITPNPTSVINDTPSPTREPITPLPTLNLDTDQPTLRTTFKIATPNPVEPSTLTPTAKPFEAETNEIVEEVDSDSSVTEINNTEGSDEEPISVDNWTPVNEYDCTGEPCPISTHCRSRYSSCGPGFIYCNVYSIWKNTCPPPGTRPSRTPTQKPTREQVPSASPIKSTIFNIPEGVSKPTLPPLPKPSLPTITETMSVVLPSSSTLISGISTADTDEETDTETDDVEAIFNVDKKESVIEKPPSASYFDSPTYFEEWMRSGMDVTCLLSWRTYVISAIAFLALL